MRGEFIRGDGLVLPNNITPWGAEQILRAALLVTRPNIALWMRLVNGVFFPDMQASDLQEPMLDTNGYSPLETRVDGNDWSNMGRLNGEPYIDSVPRIFQASGTGFSRTITRVALTPNLALTGDVFALSSPLPSPLQILPSTPMAERTFRYRLYLR